MKTTAYAWDQVLRAARAAVEPHYAIECLVGVGGMASVYRARRQSDGAVVALKILHPGLIRNDADRARFEREARTLSRLDHPCIVHVHGVFERAGLLCLDMKYMAGGPLDRIIAEHERGLPLPIALHWLAQAASAVAYAHLAGVLHRDLTTSNLLLDPNGNIAVADFGLASVAGEASLTDLGQWIGTPAYMSPEQFEDEPASAASDQYALGIIAYELVAGRRPFYGSARTIVQAHLAGAPPPLTGFRPDCPPQLAAAIHRMLARTAAARFPSILDAAAALEARELTAADAHTGQLRQLITPAPPG